MRGLAMTGHLWTDPLMYLSYAECLLAWDKGVPSFDGPVWAVLDYESGDVLFCNVRSVLSRGNLWIDLPVAKPAVVRLQTRGSATGRGI
jgi:hypothetical protein